MKRKFFIAVVSIAVFLGACALGHAKYADLAGAWYTASPEALRAELEGYLNDAQVPDLGGEAIGFISPHAGFRFSGPVAAYTYKAAALSSPDTVIVIGFSHKGMFPGISVFTEEKYTTPMGDIFTDLELSGNIIARDARIKNFPLAFQSEQSIEMQLPFIQAAMKNTPKVVMISIGDSSFENAEILANALYEALKDRKKFVIIGSTDMCHYLPYETAKARDLMTIEAVKKFDPTLLYETSKKNRHELMCGFGAVCATMMTAKKLGADKVVVLDSANSGDTSGMKDKVVGYLSAAFVKSGVIQKEETGMFTSEQKKTLLKIARDSIIHYLRTGQRLTVSASDEALKQDMGAFVTLHERGRLRGCIGHMTAAQPLYLTVRDMAIAAATEDPRFPAVTLGEMDNIDIEISALSPMEKIDDYKQIEMGKHGVMVRSGWNSGVYLPQVATETGWGLEEFMNSLCSSKAGMPADSWKKGACDIYVFTASVFGEKDHE